MSFPKWEQLNEGGGGESCVCEAGSVSCFKESFSGFTYHYARVIGGKYICLGFYYNGRCIPSQWLQQRLQPIIAVGLWTPIPIGSMAAGAKAAAQLKERCLITLEELGGGGYLVLFCLAAFLSESRLPLAWEIWIENFKLESAPFHLDVCAHKPIPTSPDHTVIIPISVSGRTIEQNTPSLQRRDDCVKRPLINQWL